MNLLCNESKGFSINLKDYNEIKDFIYPIVTTKASGILYQVPIENTNIHVHFKIATYNMEYEKPSYLQVTKDIFKDLNISSEQLLSDAMSNLRKTKLLHLPIHELPVWYPEPTETPKHIYELYSSLTNDCELFAASFILDKKILEECSERLNDSFYIFPKNINELVILKKINLSSNIAKELSTSYIDLSLEHTNIFFGNTIYYYDFEKKELTMIN